MAGFVLDERLAADTISLGVIDDIDIRLMNDARYWWLVLVPQIGDAVEWQDLPSPSRDNLFNATMHAADVLRELTQADKMNIGALGNMVKQLHVHVIARYEGDAAWPSAVWGVGESVAYADELQGRLTRLRTAFGL